MIAKDKIYHFLAGIGAALAPYLIYCFTGNESNFMFPLVIAFAVAFGKELFDELKKKPTGFDWLDIAATMAGGILTTMIIEIIKIL